MFEGNTGRGFEIFEIGIWVKRGLISPGDNKKS
jgi:hypothetical protein